MDLYYSKGLVNILGNDYKELVYHVDNIEDWKYLLHKYDVYAGYRVEHWDTNKENSVMYITVFNDGIHIYQYGDIKYAKERYGDKLEKYVREGELVVELL